jgi:hypothetical protein
MADYKELLRKAIEALPENNGAARRAVYEKARAALVGQLRAINPPLAARDITTHRLQLEDCIRQVEQEASEAVIAGMSLQETPPPPPPVFFTNNVPQAGKAPAARQPAAPPREAPRPVAVDAGSIEAIIAAADKTTRPSERPAARPAATSRPAPARAVKPEPPKPAKLPEPLKPARSVVEARLPEPEPAPVPAPPRASSRPLPAIVARAEAAKGRGAPVPPAAFAEPAEKAFEPPPRRAAEPRREAVWAEPALRGSGAPARSIAVDSLAFEQDIPIPAAMSSVREVEVEAAPPDPQGAIDRAIATLDREARDAAQEARNEARNGASFSLVEDDDPGEDEDSAPVRGHKPAARAVKGKGLGAMFGRDKARAEPDENEPFEQDRPAIEPPPVPRPAKAAKPAPVARLNAGAVPPAKPNGKAAKPVRKDPAFARATESRRSGASAMTLFLLVFLVLLGGAGGAGYWAWQEGYIDLEAMFGGKPAAAVASAPAVIPPATPAAEAVGPGNTATPQPTAAPAPELKEDNRLAATPAAVAAAPAPGPSAPAPLQLQSTGAARVVPERLGATAAPSPDGAQDAVAIAGIDPAAAAGSQSLLLEAAAGGATGAIPFSGTVDWTRGKDETGAPTLIGKASIPARNMNVDLLIRKNSDPALPASHLMEINFSVPDTFIGGSIAGLPGVLLKNQELVQGVPLVGASARVVGNTFLFALSSSPSDTANNSALLTSRKWMDLAVIYATGKRAILTLEKDEAADTLFKDVFAAWGGAATQGG